MFIHIADPENMLIEKLIMQTHSLSCPINSDSLSMETCAHLSLRRLFSL